MISRIHYWQYWIWFIIDIGLKVSIKAEPSQANNLEFFEKKRNFLMVYGFVVVRLLTFLWTAFSLIHIKLMNMAKSQIGWKQNNFHVKFVTSKIIPYYWSNLLVEFLFLSHFWSWSISLSTSESDKCLQWCLARKQEYIHLFPFQDGVSLSNWLKTILYSEQKKTIELQLLWFNIFRMNSIIFF